MSDEEPYVPYGERSEWRDVVPMPQQDAQDGLVPIAYSLEYSNAMDYFRAIAAEREYSERVLDLTEDITRRNPAHYTVWQYRMNTLLAMQKDLRTELQLMNEFAEENLKSYQVWHHRLTLISQMQPDTQELQHEIEFIHKSLMPDAKNYHTWAYLNWLYSHFSNLPEGQGGNRFSEKAWARELKWCNNMLDSAFQFRGLELAVKQEDSAKHQSDVSSEDEGQEAGAIFGRGDGRNNSAWSWRWHLAIARKGAKPDPGVEIEYALSQIRAIPHNASAWNYLRGVHKRFAIPLSQSLPAILPFTTIPDPSLAAAVPSNPPSVTTAENPDTPLPIPFAIEWLADCEAEKALMASSSSSYERAAGLYSELAERWDVMRRTYWRHRQADALRRASLEHDEGRRAQTEVATA